MRALLFALLVGPLLGLLVGLAAVPAHAGPASPPASGPATSAAPRPRAPGYTEADLRRGIRCAGRRCLIDEPLLDAILSDAAPIAATCRIALAMRGGRYVGFELRRIPDGSVLERLGFRDGDVVVELSGMPVATPEEALAAYTALRSRNRVVVTLLRHGRPMSIEITAVEPRPRSPRL